MKRGHLFLSIIAFLFFSSVGKPTFGENREGPLPQGVVYVKDTRTKAQFYPTVEKNGLLRDGYMAARSSHSRGSTVDLTIISIGPGKAGAEPDMGTHFDLFGPASSLCFPAMSPEQRAHRMRLHSLMKMHGFEPYPLEGWHVTLKSEPFPETYFNFPVR